MRNLFITLGFLMLAVPAWGACLASPSDAYTQAICALSPVEAYRLNDTSSSAVDYSGNSNTGTYVGTVNTDYTQSVTGPFTSGSHCTTLTTSSGYITAPNVTGLASKTLLITVKLANASTAGNAIMMGNTTTGYGVGFGDTISAANWNHDGTELLDLFPGVAYHQYNQHPAVTPGMFAMIAIVIDVSDHGTIYYDGQQYSPTTTNADITTLGQLYIGGLGAGTPIALAGTVCDAAVFNAALSGAQIATLWADFLALRVQQSSANSYQAVILQDDPAMAWPLNETSGTAAADITGFGGGGTYRNTPTLNQTGPAPGYPAITLDGSTQAVTFPVGQMQFNAGTYECWVALQTGGSFGGAIVREGQDGAGGSSIGIDSTSGNFASTLSQLSTLAARTSSVNFGTLGTATNLTANVFTLVDVTIDPSNVFTAYENGVLTGVTANPGFTTRASTSAALGWWTDNGSGTGGTGHDSFLGGKISNCALYPYVLSSTQMLAHYNAMPISTGGWFAP